ncbi:unnamed protein product [Withania somnifera]
MKGREEMLWMLNHQFDQRGGGGGADERMMGFRPSDSSSFTGGFGLYDDESSMDSWNVFDQNVHQGHLFNEQNFDKVVDVGLSRRFYGMNIDEKVGFNDHLFNGTGNSHHRFCDFQGSRGVLEQRGNLCDSMGFVHSSPFSRELCYREEEQMNYLCNMSSRPCSNESFRYSEHSGFIDDDRSFFSSLHGSQLMGLSSECDCSIARQRTKSISSSITNHPLAPLPNSGSEDSFILQGEYLKYGYEQRGLKGLKKKTRNELRSEWFQEKKSVRNSLLHLGDIELRGGSRNDLALKKGNIENSVYLAAKDQMGCRHLQKIFDEGTSEDVEIIFNGIIHHIFELMKGPFGNYLVQKLLTVCSDEQRMQFVLMVTKDPGELVKASRTTHGTRVVQKLIETMKTRMEINLVIRALQPGILSLMMDVNGNHVIQRCLHCLSKDHNKIIFYVATKHCVDIATHRYGCCVLNKCITYSTGKQREKLLVEICSNGLELAQDPFGNYVVQFIIELKIPSVAAILLPQFERHYVYLSRQKFSSHVIEKLLKCFEESRSKIINELVSEPHFDQLLQDPFANYVIQSALGVTKGSARALLLHAVRPHMLLLRTSPYCKKIFSRRLLKK